MHQIFYDFHIHTALSPCADDDMLPCDIVGMAVLSGLDAIAVTDHNSLANVKAVCEAAREARAQYELPSELIVLPGVEVTTSEEVHALALFDECGAALAFEGELSRHYSQLPNRADIFGEQLVCDKDGNVTGKLERMLISPANISFDDLCALTLGYGGAFVPAHVDRGSFSVTSNLGFLPPDLPIAAVEFSSRSPEEDDKHDFYGFTGKKFVFSSDAHNLHAINERIHFIELPERSARAVIEYLRS